MNDGGSFVAFIVEVIQRVGNVPGSLQQLCVREGRSTEKSLCKPRLHLMLRQQGVQRAASEVFEYDEAPRRSARPQYLQLNGCYRIKNHNISVTVMKYNAIL